MDAYLHDRQFACKGAIAHVEKRVIDLEWQKSCSYNSVYSWVKAALGENAVTFVLWTSQPSEGRAPRAVSTLPGAPLPLQGGIAQIAVASAPAHSPMSSVAVASTPSSVSSLMQSWLVLKAIGLKGKKKSAVVVAIKDAYQEQELVGQGTFGKVVRARCKTSGQIVCLKELRDTNFQDFLHELVLLSRVQHANVVAVLDVFVLPVATLVLADAGSDLSKVIRAGPCPVAGWPGLVSQMLAGIKCLHEHLVIHSDLKPSNICVDLHGQLRIVDLGCGVVSVVGFRSERSAESVAATGLEYCTLWYRAPEVLLGDIGFSFPVDVWAAGCCWVEMLTRRPLFKAETSQLGMIISIFRLVGSPGVAELPWFQTLPHWKQQFPMFGAPSFETVLLGSFNPSAVEQLPCLLTAFPMHRVTAADALVRWQLSMDLASPTRMSTALVSVPASSQEVGAVDQRVGSPDLRFKLVTDHDRTMFVGKRGSFNLLEGGMGTPVLEWLRADPVFDFSAGHAGWAKKGKGARHTWTENGKKLELIGHLGADLRRPKLTLNGKDASQPMFPRIRAWAAAFRVLNALLFRKAQTQIRANLRKLPKAKLGLNGQVFFDEDIESWVADLGSMQIMLPSDRKDPEHFDGGASFVHLGLTLWGGRSVVVELEEGASPIKITSVPGHVYMGCLCCASHHVQHSSEGGELLNVNGLGGVEVVLLMRSRMFRHTRGTTMQGPNPKEVFQAALAGLVTTLSNEAWHLPSLAECEAALTDAA